MFQIKMKPTPRPESNLKQQDIIVKRLVKKITYKNGARIEENTYKEVNLTKLANESKKLVKTDQAAELSAKIDELKSVFSK